MSMRSNKLSDSILRIQAEEETLLRLSKVCQHSGIRGQGISKLIFENENSIQVLRSYCKDEKDPCCVARIMQMYANSVVMKQFFKSIAKFSDNQINILSLLGCKCSDVVTLQCLNRLSIISVKSIEDSMLCFGFFESFIEDAELFFEDLLYAVDPYFSEHGVGLASIVKPVPWIGEDLSDCLMSRRLMNQACKQSKLTSVFSWAKNWKGLGFMKQ